MTDNGSSFRSHRYAKALRRLKIKHLRTRPYTPKTMMAALGPDRDANQEVRRDLAARGLPFGFGTIQRFFARHAITRKKKTAQGSKPPIGRLSLPRDNVLRLHI
jgi:transposase InsO family protein